MPRRTKDRSGWMDYAHDTLAAAKTLQPGDKVKFVNGHPWDGEIGAYLEMREMPIVGLMHVFVVVGKSGMTAAARPNQFARI